MCQDRQPRPPARLAPSLAHRPNRLHRPTRGQPRCHLPRHLQRGVRHGAGYRRQVNGQVLRATPEHFN